MAIGAVLICIPLQHYMDLSRFQHYSFAMLSVALGFVLQTVVSWRQLIMINRLTLLSSGLYIGAFSIIFLQSPWLDFDHSLETSALTDLRHFYAQVTIVCGIPLAVLWLFWGLSRHRDWEQRFKYDSNREDASE